MGQRWEAGKQWNLTLKDADGNAIDPELSIKADQQVTVDFPTFDNAGNGVLKRHINAKKLTFADGSEHFVTTVFDLMMSQYGIKRDANDDLAAKAMTMPTASTHRPGKKRSPALNKVSWFKLPANLLKTR